MPEFFIKKVPAPLTVSKQCSSLLTTCVWPKNYGERFGYLLQYTELATPKTYVVTEEIQSEHVEIDAPQVDSLTQNSVEDIQSQHL